MIRSDFLHLGLVSGLLLVAGCSCRPRPALPPFNTAMAAQAAIETYDADGNGKLDAAELARCPALLIALPRADTDGDGALSADEIAAHIARWVDSGATLMDADVLVTLDGRPLAGAEVAFEPEEFLRPYFIGAWGVTGETGRAPMTALDATREGEGVRVGAYRVLISKAADGREILPARYNTASQLGVEVAGDVPDLPTHLEFHLKSR